MTEWFRRKSDKIKTFDNDSEKVTALEVDIATEEELISDEESESELESVSKEDAK